MSGCLDNIHCECLDLQERRNAVASITSGVFFFVGWWIILDVAATPTVNHFHWAYYICGVVGTIAMFMINAISNNQVRGDAMTDGALGTKGARIWLLFGFVLAFGALIASIWIMFQAYVLDSSTGSTWPGVGLFLENFLIFLGTLIYKFGRTEDLWG